MWYKISMVGSAALIIPFSVYMMYVESQHEHHPKPNYDHFQIRTKVFPWGKCDLLDGHCRRKERGEVTDDHHH